MGNFPLPAGETFGRLCNMQHAINHCSLHWSRRECWIERRFLQMVQHLLVCFLFFLHSVHMKIQIGKPWRCERDVSAIAYCCISLLFKFCQVIVPEAGALVVILSSVE